MLPCILQEASIQNCGSLYYDFSLLHNAKCAYLFTTKAMYFDGKEFPYADIKEIIAIKGKILIKLKNGKYFENSEVVTPVKHENFGDMMRNLKRNCRDRDFRFLDDFKHFYL